MATDAHLLDAALLVFEQAGLRGATMRRIADEAGVNEVTLFRRFGSKERLLLAALRRHADRDAGGQLPADPVDPSAELEAWALVQLRFLLHARVLLRSTMTELDAHPEVCSSVQLGPAKIAADLTAYLLKLRARGQADGEWDPELAAWMLMGTLFSEAMGQDMPGRHGRPPEEVARHHVHLFTRAIGARVYP